MLVYMNLRVKLKPLLETSQAYKAWSRTRDTNTIRMDIGMRMGSG